MSLSEIYSNRIKKAPVSTLSVGSHFPTMQTKDPTIEKLQQSLSAKIQEIMPKEEIAEPPPQISLKSFSFEDALRELAQLKK